MRETLPSSPEARPFLLALGFVAAVAAVGLIVLWPGDTEGEVGAGIAGDTVRGDVVSIEKGPCPGAAAGEATCVSAGPPALTPSPTRGG